jgi:hypothetical protein
MKGIATKAQPATRLPPLASSDEKRLAIALAKIGRLHAELRLQRAQDEIEQMLRRCDEIEHLLFLAMPKVCGICLVRETYPPACPVYPQGQFRALMACMRTDYTSNIFATKTCLIRRLRCHQPPRDKTFSSDA